MGDDFRLHSLNLNRNALRNDFRLHPLDLNRNLDLLDFRNKLVWATCWVMSWGDKELGLHGRVCCGVQKHSATRLGFGLQRILDWARYDHLLSDVAARIDGLVLHRCHRTHRCELLSLELRFNDRTLDRVLLIDKLRFDHRSLHRELLLAERKFPRPGDTW